MKKISETHNIILTVREMRKAQRDYYKLPHGTTQKRDKLQESKAIEHKVDKLIANYFNPQSELF